MCKITMIMLFVGNDMKKAQVPEKSVLTNWFSLFTSDDKSEEEEEEEEEEKPPAEATPKRGRGRPRLTPKPTPTQEISSKSEDHPKRGRGRPKKNVEDGQTPAKKKEVLTPKGSEDVEDKGVKETPAGEGRTRRGTRVTDLRNKLDTSVEESPSGERKSARKKTVFTCDDCKETFQMEYLLLVHKKRCKRESLLTSPPKSTRKTPAKTSAPQKKAAVAGTSGTAVTPKIPETKQQVEEKKGDEVDLSKIDISTVVMSGASTIVITESVTGDLQGDEGTVESSTIKLTETEESKEKEGEEDKWKSEEGGESQSSETAESQMKEEEQEREEEEMEEEEDAEEDDGGEWKPSQPDAPPPAKRRRGRGPSRRALAMIEDDDEEYRGSKRKRKILLNMKQAIQVLKLTPKRKVHPDSGMAEVNRVAEKVDAVALLQTREEEGQEEDNQEEEQSATEQVAEAAEEVTNGESQPEQIENQVTEEENHITKEEHQVIEEENQNSEELVAELKVKEEKLPLKVVVESIPSDDEQDISEADYLDVAEIEKMVDLSSSDCAICGMHFKVCTVHGVRST